MILPDNRYKKREDRRQMYLVQTARNCDPYLANSGTLQELIDQSSGSGSGLPLLVSTVDYTFMFMIRSLEH
jgi:hypothetical protein